MERQSLIALLSLVGCLALLTESDACKYTVRDVAFVDLGEMPYRLFVVTKNSDSVALASALKIAADSVLANANVTVELADVGKTLDHPAAEFAARAGVTKYPVAVLVSPDDRAMRLDWQLSADTTAEQLSPRFRDLATSPRRTEIFDKVLDVHSVILVVDGKDEKVNRETTALAENAIPQVKDALEFMPKPMKHPPHMIHFTQEEAQRESILLWSLGVDLSDSAPTQIALVFGRGRQLGPVLRFPADEPRQFMRSLAFVGQDCECGLDRRWMQGQMIPHLWTNQDETLAMQKLNFDPGNALVKAEIDRILARGPGSRPGGQRDVEQSELMFPALGYQEIVLFDEPKDDQPVESVAADDEPQQDGPPHVADPANSAGQTPVVAEVVVLDEVATPPNYTLIGLVILAVLIVAVGSLIMLRGSGAWL